MVDALAEKVVILLITRPYSGPIADKAVAFDASRSRLAQQVCNKLQLSIKTLWDGRFSPHQLWQCCKGFALIQLHQFLT